MTVKTYQSTNKTLLDKSWIGSDETTYFQLVSSSYTFDATHTTSFDVQAYFVGSAVAIAGESVENTYLTCSDVIPPAETASYGIAYSATDLLFYFDINSGSDYAFDASLKLNITTLLNFPASSSVFTSQLKSYHYDGALKVLYSYPFASEGYIYTAQLLNDGYTFDSSHSTRADIAAYASDTPAVLTGKTVTYSGDTTTIDCDDILFDATYNGAYLAITYSPSGSPQNTDELVTMVEFDNGESTSVDRAIVIQSTGLITIDRAT